MKKLISFLSVFLLAFLIIGCSNGGKDESKDESNSDIAIFVNTDYVKENIDNKDIIFLDARGEPKEKTLKNAVVINWNDLADMSAKAGEESFGVALDATKASKVLSEKGIAMDKEIIIFAQTLGAWGEDGRIFWQLKSLGYKNLKIVDGGIGAIESNGLPTQNGGSKLDPVTVKIDKVDTSSTINTEDLEKLIDEKNSKTKIIDTRAKDEYEGAQKFGEAKGGKIPGSINIEFNNLLDDKGYIKSKSDIEKIMSDNGITKDDEIVTYCTAGIRSAYMQVVLSEIGYNVKNYDQSFYHWSAVNDVE